MDAGGLLLPAAPPSVGAAGGTPQLLLGLGAPTPIGAPASLLVTPDPRGREWTMLAAEVDPGTVGLLRSAGPSAEPLWPLLVRNAHGRVTWDGLTSIAGVEAVRIGRITLSWIHDGDALHVVAVGRLPETTPERLLGALAQAGLATGLADRAGHPHRWLVANLNVADPSLTVPADAPSAEVEQVLADRLGYAGVTAMRATARYDHRPHVGPAGIVSFKRLRVAAPTDRLAEGTAVHHVAPVFGGGGILDVLESGVLLSQRRRRLLGLPAGFGSSERSDRATGKAGRVFVDLSNDPIMPPLALVWSDVVGRLMSRLDFAVVVEDLTPMPLGMIPQSPVEYDPTGRSVANSVIPQQIGIGMGIDLFGPHGPDRIAVRDDVERNDVLACLRAKGVERLGWSEIGDAVVVNPIAVRAGATV